MENQIEKAKLEGFKEAILTVSGKNAILMTRAQHNSEMANLAVVGLFFCAAAAFVAYAEHKGYSDLVKKAYDNGVKDGFVQSAKVED